MTPSGSQWALLSGLTSVPLWGWTWATPWATPWAMPSGLQLGWLWAPQWGSPSEMTSEMTWATQ